VRGAPANNEMQLTKRTEAGGVPRWLSSFEGRFAADLGVRRTIMVAEMTTTPKLRGGRRYYRGLARWLERISLDLGPETWYDMWHAHPDFYGWSTRGPRARRAHLVVLFQAFERVLNQVPSYGRPVQVFVAVNGIDSPGNAIYIHTPNPNGQAFPYEFEGYRWAVPVPSWLHRFVDTQRFEIGQTVFEGEERYVVVHRETAGRLTTRCS
jgi:hypothetical protein